MALVWHTTCIISSSFDLRRLCVNHRVNRSGISFASWGIPMSFQTTLFQPWTGLWIWNYSRESRSKDLQFLHGLTFVQNNSLVDLYSDFEKDLRPVSEKLLHLKKCLSRAFNLCSVQPWLFHLVVEGIQIQKQLSGLFSSVSITVWVNKQVDNV